MSQNLQSILEAAHQLPADELRQLIEHLLADVSTELQSDDRLRQEILEAEQQIRRGEVVPWSEAKHRRAMTPQYTVILSKLAENKFDKLIHSVQ